MSQDNGLRLAIAKVGSVRKLANLIGCSHTAILNWRNTPAHRIIEVERVSGVPREILRPDLYRQQQQNL